MLWGKLQGAHPSKHEPVKSMVGPALDLYEKAKIS